MIDSKGEGMGLYEGKLCNYVLIHVNYFYLRNNLVGFFLFLVKTC